MLIGIEKVIQLTLITVVIILSLTVNDVITVVLTLITDCNKKL